MKLNSVKLKKFLVEATQFGYANPKKAAVTKEINHSTTIKYTNGDWSSNDNFFGGEPYGGRQVVFYKDRPVYIMVYYGMVEENAQDLDSVYKFLQKALSKIPTDYPYRGPKNLSEKNLQYLNSWHGEIERFAGEEVILQNGKQIYQASYMGGLVDRRKSEEI